MVSAFDYLDGFLFGVLPYLSLFIFLLVTIQRYLSIKFSFSSLSSQFLENKQHFWGMVPFHYGILAVLAGHVIAFLIPEQILTWNTVSWRLYVLELSGLIFALLTLIGLFALLYRRFNNTKLKMVTSTADWILYLLLFFQVVGGIYVAVYHRWGSSWFSISLVPYLWSLIKLNPDILYVAGMPLMVKLHIINAFAIIGFFPFTRLVHILVVPNPYLWRKIQVVRWYRDRSSMNSQT